MAADEFRKLSPEQLQKLSRAISDAKALPNQQAEIIEDVIAGEIEIGKLRISYLNEYFDIYSKSLDLVARKHSALNDAFLVLDHKINESFKKVVAEGTKAVAELVKVAEKATGSTSKASSEPEDSADNTQGGKSAPAKQETGKDSDRPDTSVAKAIIDLQEEQLRQHAEYTGKIADLLTSIASLELSRHQLGRNEVSSVTDLLISKFQEAASGIASTKAVIGVEQRDLTKTPVDQINPTENLTVDLALAGYRPYVKAGAPVDEPMTQPKVNETESLSPAIKSLSDLLHASVSALASISEIAVQAGVSLTKYGTPTDTTTGSSGGGGGTGPGGNNKNNSGSNPPASNEVRPFDTLSGEQREEAKKQDLALIDKFIGGVFSALKRGSEESAEAAAAIAEQYSNIGQLDAYNKAREAEQINALASQREEVAKQLMELERARRNDEASQMIRLTELQLDRIQETVNAELKAQELINNINTERKFDSSDEGHLLHITADAAAEKQKSIHKIQADRVAFIAKKELELKLKNNGKIHALELAEIKKQADLEYELTEERIEKETKLRLAEEAKAKRDEEKAEAKARAAKGEELFTTLTGAGNSIKDRIDAFKDLATNQEKGKTDLKSVATMMVKAIGTFAAKLEDSIDRIASSKAAIDTRLQGSSNETTRTGSYWDKIVKDMASVGAINPYFKQEDFAKNIKDLVNRGIAFDLEQRAFLMTIQEKIANTFNVADGTLLRLIRIQQEDSTAGRLGMEASLNAFLNEMYETTEYMGAIAEGVRGSLDEMEALMSGAEATEVEYQVQKWLGSLYSVGISQNAVNSISQTLGQIASGQIDGLTNGGAGNLLVMAANDAGLSIADVLTKGLDASATNKLMQAVVNYLAEIAESSKDNNVVQQQLANVFGVKASDLRAATNLASRGSVESIYGESKTYENLLNTLFTMAGSMSSRTSIAEMMANVWENGKYTLAGGVASSPVSYIIYKAASLLDDTVGGITIPDISVLGNGVALNTTVADLMRVASMSTGIIGSIGSIIAGLGNSFNGQRMLNQLGISSGSGLAVTPRGGATGGGMGAAGGTISESGYYAGNSSGSDIKNSTIQESKDTKKQLMVEAKEEEEANQVNTLNTTVLKIYELLDDVAHGNNCLHVKVEGYGLTKGSSNTLGGVGALSSSSLSENTTSSLGGSINSSSFAGNVDFGGWTTVM